MKERPILFSGPMVRAILDGRKTQTRRVITQQTSNGWAFDVPPQFGRITSPHPKKGRFGAFIRHGVGTDFPSFDLIPCPYGMPGDRLWVRETWRGVVAINPPGKTLELGVARYVPDQEYCRRVEFQATQARDSEPWRPSIHMPRWASRITLEIVSVRVERLQQIDEAGAKAEGVEPVTHAPIWPTFEEKHQWRGYMNYERAYRDTALDSFNSLWRSINGPESWEANPWVWVVEFKRIEA